MGHAAYTGFSESLTWSFPAKPERVIFLHYGQVLQKKYIGEVKVIPRPAWSSDSIHESAIWYEVEDKDLHCEVPVPFCDVTSFKRVVGSPKVQALDRNGNVVCLLPLEGARLLSQKLFGTRATSLSREAFLATVTIPEASWFPDNLRNCQPCGGLGTRQSYVDIPYSNSETERVSYKCISCCDGVPTQDIPDLHITNRTEEDKA